MNNHYMAWVLRYVPHSARGEFVNFGVLAGRDDGDWALRHTADLTRANCITPALANPADLLSRFTPAVDVLNGAELPAPTADDAQRLWAPRQDRLSTAGVLRTADLSRNALQFSPPIPSVGASAAEVVDRLYDLLVVDPVHVSRPRPRTIIRRRVQDLLIHENVPAEQTRRGQRLTSRNEAESVDFLFGPHGPVKLTQCLTFARKAADDSRQEAAAWSFFVAGIRARGATTTFGTGKAARTVGIPEDIPVSVIYDEPAGRAQRDALDAAMDGWERVNITPVPITRAAADIAHTAELIPA